MYDPLNCTGSILPIGHQPPHIEDRSARHTAFDPSLHLRLSHPSTVTLLDWSTITEPAPGHGSQAPAPQIPNGASDFAFSSAFSVLSPQGVSELRGVIQANPELVLRSKRISAGYVRGLAYASEFVRQFNNSPVMLDHLSRIVGARLVPHYMHTNYSHVNLSTPPPRKHDPAVPMPPVVDSWHVDSVPFVLVVVVSDMRDMIGGVFQAIKRRGKEAAFKLIEESGNKVPEADMMQVSYAQMGWGIFMQGSEVMHRVSPVLQGLEPRITVVNSYSLANVFAIDRTLPSTFVNGNDGTKGEREAVWEIYRGRLHRSEQQLAHLKQHPFTEDRELLAKLVRLAADDLNYLADTLSGAKMETAGYFDEKEGKVLADKNPKSSKL